MSTYVQYLLHTELTTFTMPACLLGAPAKFGLNRVTPHMCVPVAYWSSLVHVDAQPTSMIIDGTKASPPATAAAASRGAFILLEGVDRCGKTTQCALLLKHLLSLSMAAVALRFPDRTTQVGKLIDGYLQSGADLDDRAVHLLFSANRWEAAPSLAQTLAEGKTIVCDRYAYSGVAFSSAKTKEDRKAGGDGAASGGSAAEDLSIDWCKGPDVGLPAPDCVLFLDLSQDEAEKRGG